MGDEPDRETDTREHTALLLSRLLLVAVSFRVGRGRPALGEAVQVGADVDAQDRGRGRGGLLLLQAELHLDRIRKPREEGGEGGEEDEREES